MSYNPKQSEDYRRKHGQIWYKIKFTCTVRQSYWSQKLRPNPYLSNNGIIVTIKGIGKIGIYQKNNPYSAQSFFFKITKIYGKQIEKEFITKEQSLEVNSKTSVEKALQLLISNINKIYSHDLLFDPKKHFNLLQCEEMTEEEIFLVEL